MAAQKGWKNMGRLAGVANCGWSQKGVAEEDSCQGFNPGVAAMWGLTMWFGGQREGSLDHVVLGSRKTRCSSHSDLSVSSSEECRSDNAGPGTGQWETVQGRKGVKAL